MSHRTNARIEVPLLLKSIVKLTSSTTKIIVCLFLKWMDWRAKFIVRISVCCQNCFWTTKLCIMMSNHFSFTSWLEMTAKDAIWLDTFLKRNIVLRDTMFLASWLFPFIRDLVMEDFWLTSVTCCPRKKIFPGLLRNLCRTWARFPINLIGSLLSWIN